MHLSWTSVKRCLIRRLLVSDIALCRFHSTLGGSCAHNWFLIPDTEKLIRRKESCGVDDGSRKWKLPSGYKTDINVYNPIVKNKVPLVLRSKSFATWYMCGPTVYDSAHIGHACCYVKFDVIRRVMEEFFGINVVMAMSITDIDDKIINRAKERKEDFSCVSNRYEAEFWEDMKALNVTPPNASLRVTKNINEIIYFITKIIDAGMAYAANDGSVYFDTGSYSSYGKFMAVSPEEPESHGGSNRVSVEKIKYKKSPLDFALWKASQYSDEPGWSSPWGRGRPGWHIECSAMASKLFGSKVDLHSGGIDLVFPHHENEEAQSCAHHGVSQWVNYWLHSGHLHLKGQQKMSKSLKNTLSIQEFLSDFTPNQFRMFCLLSHYRSGVAYTEETMGNAVAVMNKVECFLADASAYILGKKQPVYLDELELDKNISHFQQRMKTCLADDFNTPAAMSSLIELITYCNKILNPSSKLSKANLNLETNSCAPITAVALLIMRTLEKLGIDFKCNEVPSNQEPTSGKGQSRNWKQFLDMGVDFRSEVRSLTLMELKGSKDLGDKEYFKNILKACDNFRKNMAAEGITVKDHEKSSSWTVAESDGKGKN